MHANASPGVARMHWNGGRDGAKTARALAGSDGWDFQGVRNASAAAGGCHRQRFWHVPSASRSEFHGVFLAPDSTVAAVALMPISGFESDR